LLRISLKLIAYHHHRGDADEDAGTGIFAAWRADFTAYDDASPKH
jgi:hypothetical protein